MSKKLCFFLIFLSLEAGAFEIPTNLRSGDLIFLSLNCYACKLIEATTHSHFSHVGIISRDGVSVIMAAEPHVSRVDLAWLVSHANAQPVFMRFKDPQNSALAAGALEIARSYLGRPYDPNFDWGDDKLYCSELVFFSFNRAARNPQFPFRLKVMHFAPYTREWREVLGHEPPEGQPGVSPEDLAESPYFEKIPSF